MSFLCINRKNNGMVKDTTYGSYNICSIGSKEIEKK